MQHNWFYELLGEEFGPVPYEQIKSLVDAGTLSLSDKVRPQEGGPYRSITSVFEQDAATGPGMADTPPDNSVRASDELSIDDFQFATEADFSKEPKPRRKAKRSRHKNERREQASLVENAYEEILGDKQTEPSSDHSPEASTAESDKPNLPETSRPEPANLRKTNATSTAPTHSSSPSTRSTPVFRPRPAMPSRSQRSSSFDLGHLLSDSQRVLKVAGVLGGCAVVYFAYTFLFSPVPDAANVEASLRDSLEQYDRLSTNAISQPVWDEFEEQVKDEVYGILKAYRSASGEKDDRDIQLRDAAIALIDLVNCSPNDKERQAQIRAHLRDELAGQSDEG